MTIRIGKLQGVNIGKIKRISMAERIGTHHTSRNWSTITKLAEITKER